jgi:hypothetical protein
MAFEKSDVDRSDVSSRSLATSESHECSNVERAIVSVSSESDLEMQLHRGLEFDSMSERMRRIEEAVSCMRKQLCAVPTAAPLAEYQLRITDHSRCPSTGRQFIPAGEAQATKCVKTQQGGFPHIIKRVLDEEGGGDLYYVITGKNVMITASVGRVSTNMANNSVSENTLIAEANRLMQPELEAAGEFPLLSIRMRMRLVAAHIPHRDPAANPVGIGCERWWDKDLSTEIDGQRDKAQLLVPAETSGAYTQAFINGRVAYSFKLRSGVTSSACRAHKNCLFKFVFEPESKVLRERCASLTASTPAFRATSKYNSGVMTGASCKL